MHVTIIQFIDLYINKHSRLAIQRLEIAKNDLQNRIAKEVSEECAHVLINLVLVASCSLIVKSLRLGGMQFYKQVWKEESKRYMNADWLWNRMYALFPCFLSFT